MIIASHISKRFGKILSLDNVSFEIYDREIVAIIGSNGSGKSTLTRILCGVYKPSIGQSSIYGLDSWKDRRKIWKFLEYMTLDEKLIDTYNVYENAQLFSPGEPLETIRVRVDRLLDKDHLYLPTRDRLRKLSEGSTGMQQKAYIATLEDLPVMFIDEPGGGLDPNTVQRLKEHILKQKKTIVWITHKMPVAESVNRVFIIINGKLIGWGPPRTLMRWLNADNMETVYMTLSQTDTAPVLKTAVMEAVPSPEINEASCFIDQETFTGGQEILIGTLLLQTAQSAPRQTGKPSAIVPKIYLHPENCRKLRIDKEKTAIRSTCWKD
jgi:ABC-2 type transport system ATP-binding protein